MNLETYEKMQDLYSKESKKDLIDTILSLQEIEVKDRAFANQCQSGTAIMSIDLLLNKLTALSLKNGNSQNDLLEILSLLDSAVDSFNYIKQGLSEINNSFRCTNSLDNFKQNISDQEKAKCFLEEIYMEQV